MLTGYRLVDCSWGSRYNFISDAYQTNSIWINERYQIFLVTLDLTLTKTILRCSIWTSVFLHH